MPILFRKVTKSKLSSLTADQSFINKHWALFVGRYWTWFHVHKPERVGTILTIFSWNIFPIADKFKGFCYTWVWKQWKPFYPFILQVHWNILGALHPFSLSIYQTEFYTLMMQCWYPVPKPQLDLLRTNPPQHTNHLNFTLQRIRPTSAGDLLFDSGIETVHKSVSLINILAQANILDYNYYRSILT